MSALAHFMEDEGIATTGISLVREHTEQMRPPRALWVPFELGRPLGVPDNPAFQHRVMNAAFALLHADSGPVLEDYPEEAESDVDLTDDDAQAWVCPVSFARADTEGDEVDAVEQEMAQLMPWFEMASRERGRTTTGSSGKSPADALQYVGQVVRQTGSSTDAELLNRCLEDLKAFYLESATAQPGRSNGIEVNAWLWHETRLSALLRVLDRLCKQSDDQELQRLATKNFIPRSFR